MAPLKSTRPPLQSLFDYVMWLKPRVGWILAGGAGAAAVMALALVATPRQYSSTVIVDAGTIGQNAIPTGEIDRINGRLNGRGFREAFRGLPELDRAVRRAWLLYSEGRISIRVDATSPELAVLAVSRVASYAMLQYRSIPLIYDAPYEQLSERVARERITAIAADWRRRVNVALPVPDTFASPAAIAQFAAVIRQRTRDELVSGVLQAIARQDDLDVTHQALQTFAGVDRELQAELGPAIAVAAAGIRGRAPVPPVEPIVIAVPPTSAVADGPSRPVAIVIALLFGLVAGAFAVPLVEP